MWRWQGDEAVLVHAQHGHTAGHFFETALEIPPAEGVADQARKLKAIAPGVLRDQMLDRGDLLRGEGSAAVAHGRAGKGGVMESL